MQLVCETTIANLSHRLIEMQNMLTSRLLSLFIVLLIGATVGYLQAQDLDSTYTVPPPPDYRMPFADEEEVVSASEVIQEANSLKFDTSSALFLREVDYDSEFIPTVTDGEIKERLMTLENQIPLNFHSRVRLFIDFFSVRKRDFTLRIMQRKNLYFPMFEEMLAKYDMPDEIKYLSIIESALIPTARSRVGAVGLWQFMPYTGRMFGLSRTYSVDERMDPKQATEAACKYLKSLHDMFGDWELAIAAYNCGPGNVRKAQRRTGKKKFWDIYSRLPRETRSYLPQFVAMMYVLNYAEEHNLIQDRPQYPIPTEEVFVNQSVDLGKLAKELDMCEEDLSLMNPKYRRGYVPASTKTSAKIRIPSLRFEYFVANRKAILDSAKYAGGGSSYAVTASEKRGDKYYHTVRRGEVLGLIAQRNRVRLSDLRRWNNLYTNTIYPGQKLLIYGPGAAPPRSSNTTARQSTPKASPQPSSVPNGKVHVVRRGDTLWGIAKQYEGVTVDKLKKLNNLQSNKLKIGQRLKLG